MTVPHHELLLGHEQTRVDAEAEAPPVGHEEVGAVRRHNAVHHLQQQALGRSGWDVVRGASTENGEGEEGVEGDESNGGGREDKNE